MHGEKRAIAIVISAGVLAAACAPIEREPGEALTFRTTSPATPTLIKLTSDHPADLAGAEVRLLLPGGVLAATLVVGRSGALSALVQGIESGALSVRQQGAPLRSRVRLEAHPAAFPGAAAARASCTDAFAAQGFSAWIIILASTPNPYMVSLPALGPVRFAFNPPQAAATRPHLPGAFPTLLMGGGSAVEVDLAAFGCDPYDIQINVWDTEGGPKPVLRVGDPTGQPLCGGIGQPACLQDPPQRLWTSMTFQTARPIAKARVDCEEVHISSFVLQ